MAESNLSEYDLRVIKLMEVVTRTETADKEQTKEMFDLYNARFAPIETGVHCTGCRARVFKRMTEYFNTVKKAN